MAYQSLQSYETNQVRDVMTPGVPIVSRDVTATEARRLLERSHCVLIVDHDDVVGIVCAPDLVGVSDDAAASSWMHAPVLGICERASLGEAQRLMTDSGLGCLPVFWNNGSLLGVVTRQDVSRPVQ